MPPPRMVFSVFHAPCRAISIDDRMSGRGLKAYQSVAGGKHRQTRALQRQTGFFDTDRSRRDGKITKLTAADNAATRFDGGVFLIRIFIPLLSLY